MRSDACWEKTWLFPLTQSVVPEPASVSLLLSFFPSSYSSYSLSSLSHALGVVHCLFHPHNRPLSSFLCYSLPRQIFLSHYSLFFRPIFLSNIYTHTHSLSLSSSPDYLNKEEKIRNEKKNENIMGTTHNLPAQRFQLTMKNIECLDMETRRIPI